MGKAVTTTGQMATAVTTAGAARDETDKWGPVQSPRKCRADNAGNLHRSKQDKRLVKGGKAVGTRGETLDTVNRTANSANGRHSRLQRVGANEMPVRQDSMKRSLTLPLAGATSNGLDLGKQSIELPFHHTIALADTLFESDPVQHFDMPVAVTDKPGSLKLECGFRDTGSANAQHVGDQLLCHPQLVGRQAIETQ